MTERKDGGQPSGGRRATASPAIGGGEVPHSSDGGQPSGGRRATASPAPGGGEVPHSSAIFTPEEQNLPFKISLPVFEGPLDLLLHLIEKHEIDLFDIPVSQITDRYLEYIDLMKTLNLDIAGEFLLMASTLALLKSRLLLPHDEAADAAGEEGPDPREELVRRLLVYQKYKDAGVTLGALPQLGRDVFVRGGKVTLDGSDGRSDPGGRSPTALPAGGGGEVPHVIEVSVFKLIEALDEVLKAAKVEIPHEVFVERINITDRINTIADRLRLNARMRFSELFYEVEGRRAIVATFLALLEMCRLKLVRVHQPDLHGEIYVSSTDNLMAPNDSGLGVESFDE